jgi:hypothetical protein
MMPVLATWSIRSKILDFRRNDFSLRSNFSLTGDACSGDFRRKSPETDAIALDKRHMNHAREHRELDIRETDDIAGDASRTISPVRSG